MRLTPRPRTHTIDLESVTRAVDALELPGAVFKTCPWEPRDLVATGLRQWLRCCGAALRDGQRIGMPSHAVDEAWHGLILCTVRYERFCQAAYGRFLHHHPEGAALAGSTPEATVDVQLDRTAVAWELVRRPGEACVLFDLDIRTGAEPAWGLAAERVARVQEQARRLR